MGIDFCWTNMAGADDPRSRRQGTRGRIRESRPAVVKSHCPKRLVQPHRPEAGHSRPPLAAPWLQDASLADLPQVGTPSPKPEGDITFYRQTTGPDLLYHRYDRAEFQPHCPEMGNHCSPLATRWLQDAILAHLPRVQLQALNLN